MIHHTRDGNSKAIKKKLLFLVIVTLGIKSLFDWPHSCYVSTNKERGGGDFKSFNLLAKRMHPLLYVTAGSTITLNAVKICHYRVISSFTMEPVSILVLALVKQGKKKKNAVLFFFILTDNEQ